MMLSEPQSNRSFALLAPVGKPVPAHFLAAEFDAAKRTEWQMKMQRLRGRLYLEDGAIEPWQLTEDGRHHLARDEHSWHLLSLENNDVVGCARLQVYPPSVSFSELGVSDSALAESDVWGYLLRQAVGNELRRAETEGLWYVEAGGWALAAELRHTTEALQIALRTYAVAQLLGHCLGLSTATMRHHSATILTRLGGNSLVCDRGALPPYYDPKYRCEMAIVAFDSRRPNPKYESLIERIKKDLPLARVYGAPAPAEALPERQAKDKVTSSVPGGPPMMGSAAEEHADVSR